MAQRVTELLLAWGDGDLSALDQLIPLVHAELRQIAARCMARERPTMQRRAITASTKTSGSSACGSPPTASRTSTSRDTR